MHSALILIDIQRGFDDPVWGARNNPDAEKNAARLLDFWRARNWPLFHVRHLSTSKNSPLAAGKSGTEFKPEVAPRATEHIIEKNVNSAFIGTALEMHLRQRGVTSLVICGLTTPHCVSTTTRMAANIGFRVELAHDACAAFDSNADMTWLPDAPAFTAQDIHNAAIAQLHGEFATARATRDIIA